MCADVAPFVGLGKFRRSERNVDYAAVLAVGNLARDAAIALGRLRAWRHTMEPGAAKATLRQCGYWHIGEVVTAFITRQFAVMTDHAPAPSARQPICVFAIHLRGLSFDW